MTPKKSAQVSLFITALLLPVLPVRMLAAAGTTQPNQINNTLGLWLRADDVAAGHKDGDRVTLWPDQSGNGFDAVFEPRVPEASMTMGLHHAPTLKSASLDGHAAVSFDANDRESLLLNRPGLQLSQNTTGFTAAFVVRPGLTYGAAPAPGVSWGPQRCLFITHVPDYNTRFSIEVETNTGEVLVRSRTRVGQIRSDFGGRKNGPSLAMSEQAWHRLIVTADYEKKEVRIMVDGAVKTYSLPPQSGERAENIPTPLVGIASNTLANWLTCQIAELACYQGALKVDEEKTLDSYFCAKYGLGK